jgi:hypothetical protein
MKELENPLSKKINRTVSAGKASFYISKKHSKSCDSFLNELGLNRDTDYTVKNSKSFSELVGKEKVKVKLISENAIAKLSPESITRSSQSSDFSFTK